MPNLAGDRLPSGCGWSTVLPDMDFECYSEAGYIWNEAKQAWGAPKGATKKGIFAVGGVVYSEHPSTEVLSLAYDLKDGLGPRMWIPGMAPPAELFEHITRGGLLEAWNCSFEYWIWKNVCVARMGWPELPFWLLRDAMAKSRANAWPGALGNAAKVADTADQKLTDGKRLIQKFSCPRKPTKKDPRRRILPADDLPDFQNMIDYNIGDIKSEAAVSALCPDLSPSELEYWLCTQASNTLGLALDMETVNAGVAILDGAIEKYNAELETITGGGVKKASEVTRLRDWMDQVHDITVYTLDADALVELLKQDDLPAPVARALQIRQLIGSAGVKKLYAMQRMASKAGRAHDLIVYHAARTGRDGGRDIQPQNLVKQGPKLYWCTKCKRPHGQHLNVCPFCNEPVWAECVDCEVRLEMPVSKCLNCGGVAKPVAARGWSWEAVDEAVKAIRTGSLEHVEAVFGDAVLTLSGCIRGLFVPGPGKDFICSDYSSVEAVCIAVLAGEEWRIEAFRRKEDIYLVSSGRITGMTLEDYAAYARENGAKHPDRQKIGKPAELGLGFGGWIGAWLQFDSSGTFTEDEIKKNIIAWREASPAIVEFWGGQVRGQPWKPTSYELYGLEGMAIMAVQNPGKTYTYRYISFEVKNDALYMRLPSGRYLTYHRPRLAPSSRWEGQLELSFEGWNSNPKMGRIGWIRIQTYGGRLAENCIAKGTKVLTPNGWKSIEDVTYSDKVHDGLDFVSHSGLLYKGVQTCIEIDNVYMTPDHEVLTNEGWKTASQKPRPYRPEIRGAGCPRTRRKRREKTKVGVPVRLRDRLRKSRYRNNQERKGGAEAELRVPNSAAYRGLPTNARNDLASGVLGLAVDDRSLSPPHPPSLGQLRGTGDSSLRPLGRVVRELLGRRRAKVPKRAPARPERQRRELHARKLPVDNCPEKLEQQAYQCLAKHPNGAYDRSRSLPSVWGRKNHNSLSNGARVARVSTVGRPEPLKSRVFDIVDAGPLHRFVVLGTEGPFIVHNCTQATARDLMAFAVPALERAGYPLVLRVHDEIIAEVPEDFGTIEEFERIMGNTPDWAKDWPIRASGGWRAKRYRKD